MYALSGNDEMSVFYQLGDGPTPNGWKTTVTADTVACMDPNAYWMWNGVNSDDITFELTLLEEPICSASICAVWCWTGFLYILSDHVTCVNEPFGFWIVHYRTFHILCFIFSILYSIFNIL